MKTEKKLSIVVPVYNMAAEGKLNYCMDSLVNQTMDDYEVIAVDDASTDHSYEILKKYQEKYPNKVKAIHYDVNRRQGGAKNEGMRHATGKWIGFIDSDDWVVPEFYEKLIGKAEETGADIVGCDYSLVNTHTFQVGKVVQNNSMEQSGIMTTERRKKLILRPGSMVIKVYLRSVLTENNLTFPENIFYEDNCAGPLWMLYFKHFEKLDEPMYFYYQHDSSTVHVISEEKCQDRLYAARCFWEECKKRGFLQEYREEIEYRFVELYYTITLFSYMQGVKKPRLVFVKEMKKYIQKEVPDFRKNHYYQEWTGEEEKKLIDMQLESDLKFYLYYRLKLLVRRIKSRLAN